MRKTSLTRGSVFALLLLLFMGFASCGTNQYTTTQTSSQPTKVTVRQIDPCSLVTKAQIERILKTQVTDVEKSVESSKKVLHDTSCGYLTSDLTIFADISLQVFQDTVTAQRIFKRETQVIGVFSYNPVNVTPRPIHVTRHIISGLGDRAVLLTMVEVAFLYVQKDNVVLSITVHNENGPISLDEQEEQQIAQIAVRKL